MGGLQKSILFGLQILSLFNAVTATDDSSSGNGQLHHPMHIKNENANLSPQIIGGSQAAAGAFPWHAWLDIQQIGSVGGYLCGASLIAPKYAMSACHCIMSTSQFKHDIVLGTINMNTPTAGYIRKTIAAPICHESYIAATAQNDVSLLPFDSPVTPTGNIKWINLPQPSLSSTNLVGTRANVSGFGRISDSTNTLSNTLKYATLTITTDASCTTEYGASWYFSDVMMCAKAPAADQADCNGDSGGALVYNNGSAWVQIGIVSWGGTSCQTTSSVYSRLSNLVGWVTNKMNSLDGVVVTTTTTNKPPTPATTRTSTSTKPPTTSTTKPPTTTTTKTTTRTTTTTTKTPTTTTIKLLPTTSTRTTTTTKPPTTSTTKPPTTTTTKTTTRTTTTTTKPPTTTTTTKTTTKPPTTTTTKTTTTKPTTTTPNPLRCASLDFKNLQTNCCSPPANNLLASSYNKTIETTCQTFGVDNSVFNVFILIKLQNILKNNTVNLNDIFNLAMQLDQAACYIECYLNQSGSVDSTGTINIDALTTLLTANQDPNGPWVDIITMAVGQCTSLIANLPLQYLPPGLITCNPTGGLIAQCVLATIVDQCPSRVSNTTCNTNYALYDQCKQLITNAVMNGP